MMCVLRLSHKRMCERVVPTPGGRVKGKDAVTKCTIHACIHAHFSLSVCAHDVQMHAFAHAPSVRMRTHVMLDGLLLHPQHPGTRAGPLQSSKSSAV